MLNVPKDIMRKIVGATKILLSLILLGLLFWKADTANILNVISSIPASLVCLLLFLWGLAYYLITVRLRWVLANCNYQIKLFPLLRIFLWGNAFSIALPTAAGGDMVMILAMRKQNPEFKWNGTTGIVLNRVIALLATAIMSAIFWLSVSLQFSSYSILCAQLAGFTVSLIVIIIFCRVSPRFENLITTVWRGRFSKAIHHAIKWSQNLGSGWTFFPIWLLAWVNQMVFLISSVLIVRFTGINISFSELAAALGIMTIATCLPISLGGHGIREASLAGSILYFCPSLPVEEVVTGTLSYSAISLGISLVWAAAGIAIYYHYDKQR